MEYVWLPEERVYGVVVSWGAYYSLVRYTLDKIDYEVLVENDDIETISYEGRDYDEQE